VATRDTLTIGLSLSLSGEYAAMGRQAEAAIRLFVADQNAAGGIGIGGSRFDLALECHDDRSDAETCADIYRRLCFQNRADLLLGPYSSRLTRVAAPIAESAGMVLVNHGGADDDLHQRGYRMIVSVLSPASDYLVGFARLLGTLRLWRKRVAILAAPTPFARCVAAGFERSCDAHRKYRRSVRIVIKEFANRDALDDSILAQLARSRINVLVAAGSYAHDVALMRSVIESELNVPVLACVAAGVCGFGADLGAAADGIIGPSQWEEQLAIQPVIGPTPAEFARRMRAAYASECDYPAAQAYAAGLLTTEALRRADTLDQQRLRDAFSDLRTTTLYGDFAIERLSGRQIGHQVLLVQWHGGRKMLISPESHADVAPFAHHPRPGRLAAILRAFQSRARADSNDDD
jgi:branched-chain amino acid transport system substrate-binding protein